MNVYQKINVQKVYVFKIYLNKLFIIKSLINVFYPQKIVSNVKLMIRIYVKNVKQIINWKKIGV